MTEIDTFVGDHTREPQMGINTKAKIRIKILTL
jgi:hypothetical protein